MNGPNIDKIGGGRKLNGPNIGKVWGIRKLRAEIHAGNQGFHPTLKTLIFYYNFYWFAGNDNFTMRKLRFRRESVENILLFWRFCFAAGAAATSAAPVDGSGKNRQNSSESVAVRACRLARTSFVRAGPHEQRRSRSSFYFCEAPAARTAKTQARASLLVRAGSFRRAWCEPARTNSDALA